MAQIAKELQISETGLSKWVKQAAIDDGAKEGLSSADRKEMAAMRRQIRQLEMENEILRRAEGRIDGSSLGPLLRDALGE